MPNRILRESILESERVDALSAEAERFYRRLMSVVDDYGRFSGNLRVLASRCFPLRADEITCEQVRAWVSECSQMHAGVTEPLLYTYEVDGKPYIQLNNLGDPRAKRSKYPAPFLQTSARICEQMSAGRVGETPPNTNSKANTNSNTEADPPEEGASPPSDAGDADTSKIATLPNREGLNGPAYRTAWQFDESFEPLMTLYRESGAAVIDDDFAEAHGAWTRLDWEARARRVDSFRAKVEAGEFADPAFIPRPRKFIESEWKRPIVTRQQQQKTKAREVRII